MPVLTALQPSFAAGELTPLAYGRVDLAKFHVGCRTLLNFFVHPQGSASNRPGTLYVGTVDDSTKRHRGIPFSFRTLPAGQTYSLIFGDLTMQVVKNNGLGAIGFVQAGGGGTYTLVTPYAYTDLPLLKFVQSADTMTLTHPSYAPRKLTRTADNNWTITSITFAPTTAAPTSLASTLGGTGGSTLVVTAIDGTSGEESLASAAASSSSTSDSWTWNAVTGAKVYNVYKMSGSVFGFIAQVATSAFTEANLAPDLADQPSTGSTNPFNAAGLWPGATGYYMQRQAFGNQTNSPGGLFFSQAGAFSNMNVSTPTQDSDAITRTLVSGEVDEIRHLIPVGTSMMILTSGAEWRCWPGPSSLALTPGTCYTVPQSDHGSSHVPPFWTENTLLMFQEKGATLQALHYDAIQDIYASQDMGVLASHLFTDVGGNYQIQERAWAAVPFKICWCVRNDGILVALTFMKEQDVYAWHRHTTAGLFESSWSITEPDGFGGYEDAVYFIVNRTIAGQTQRYVERMVSRTFPTIAQAWFVDCGLQYNGWNTGANTLAISGASYLPGAAVTLAAVGFTPATGAYYKLTGADGNSVIVQTTGPTAGTIFNDAAPPSVQGVAVANWAAMITQITNVTWLSGQTVAILGDGSVVPSGVVSNSGVVALDGPYAIVTVGLPYTSQIETLNLEVPLNGGTVQGQMKKIAEITLRVKDTRGAKVGISQLVRGGGSEGAPTVVEVKQRTNETLGTPLQPYNGDFRVSIPTEWNEEGRMYVQQDYCLPVTVLDLFPEVSVGG